MASVYSVFNKIYKFTCTKCRKKESDIKKDSEFCPDCGLEYEKYKKELNLLKSGCFADHKKFNKDCLYCHDTVITIWHMMLKWHKPELNFNRIVFPVDTLVDNESFGFTITRFMKVINEI